MGHTRELDKIYDHFKKEQQTNLKKNLIRNVTNTLIYVICHLKKIICHLKEF